MKKALLASTALAGASLLATSAVAGTPSVGDNMEVSISGTVRFSVLYGDADVDNTDRGYSFQTDESEVVFNAKATADNGIEFGLSIEIQTQPDDTNNTDEAWVFLASDDFGRVELGDQDGAADRLFVAAEDVQAGRGGFDGPAFDHFATGGARRTGPSVNVTGDAPKAIYFTPRIAGFQAGASWTPDTGAIGGNPTQDNNAGNFENVLSIGANYQQTFSDVTVTIAAVGEFGDAEVPTNEDAEIWGVGATVAFAGFQVGAGYADFNDTGLTTAQTAAGADAGNWWDVGASYATGPWKIGIGAFFGENDNATGTADTEVDIYTVNATYNFAPGLDIKGDINLIDIEGGAFGGTVTNNEGYSAVLSVQANF